MKTTLSFEFDLPEDSMQYNEIINAGKNQDLLEAIWENIFRPYHKHGYSDQEINKLLEDENCEKLFMKLNGIYDELRKSFNE